MIQGGRIRVAASLQINEATLREVQRRIYWNGDNERLISREEAEAHHFAQEEIEDYFSRPSWGVPA